jgi:hypothetical protein
MRKPLVALSILSCIGLVACNDGPVQTFNPAGPNAGQENDGQTPGDTDPTMQGFGVQGGGNTKMQICTGSQEAARWKIMDTLPLQPPTTGAGIDMSGGPSWAGLTIEAAEAINCQSTDDGDEFGDGSNVNSWGGSGEVWADYNVSNHLINFMTFWPGYVGTIDMKSRDGKDSFSITCNNEQSTKNGNGYTINWPLDAGSAALFDAEVNELYDALTATYAPGLPQDLDCINSGACIHGAFGDVAYMFFPALGTGFWVASQSQPQPVPSIFNRIDMYLAKTMPFSLASPMFKLDKVGPQGLGGTLAKAPASCDMTLGMTFGDFQTNCVDVTKDPAQDKISDNKLLGGLTHGTEDWSFDVQGVDLNFKDAQLAPTAIVDDKDFPDSADIAVTFDVDQSTLGAIANDHVGNDPSKAKDIHGAGLVYLEYARLVQEGLNADIIAAAAPGATVVTHDLGDPACLWDPIAKTGVSPDAAAKGNWPVNCTGFEGFVTAAPQLGDHATVPAYDKLTAGTFVAQAINSGMAVGLKPGHPSSTFCLDPNGDYTAGSACTVTTQAADCQSGVCDGTLHCTAVGDTTAGKACTQATQATDCLSGTCGSTKLCTSILAYSNCSAPQGAQGDIFSTSFARITQVLGKGQISNLPIEAQDVRFFWKQYVTALVKYMKAVGAGTETPEGVHSQTFDQDDIFFDSIGAGQFEIGEYVDRDPSVVNPLDLNVSADVKNGIFDEYTFSKELYRGETAIYTTVTENAADALGMEHSALLTNVFGSNVLATEWAQSSAGMSPYYCATNNDPTNCDGQLPPLDANGNLQLNSVGQPRLARYKGAFAGQATAFTLGDTAIKVTMTYDTIQQAMVNIPIYGDPYAWTNDGQGTIANSSTPAAPLSILVPWAPLQPGIGFPVALSGTLDKFIETSQLDFSGTTISANVDYNPAVDPSTGAPATDGSISFLAVETSEFLGEVFLCRDAPTGDLLGIRMYTPVATILDWLGSHPGSYDACGIIIRYSPYGNYADYITSLTNGVRLNITQGGGFGRVVDVTLFVPGQ